MKPEYVEALQQFESEIAAVMAFPLLERPAVGPLLSKLRGNPRESVGA